MKQAETPRWHQLLSLALKQLESAGLTRSDWSWGGGTVLMLRHQHRLSWDIDLFLGNVQQLNFLSPRLNNAIGATISRYTEQANHLRFFIDGIGEIDYLSVQPVIDIKPESMEVDGHGLVNVLSDREILAQKIQYRSCRFAGRDLFDFGLITTLRPDLLADEALRQIGEINKDALHHRLNSPSLRAEFGAIRPHPHSTIRLSFNQAQAIMSQWLEL